LLDESEEENLSLKDFKGVGFNKVDGSGIWRTVSIEVSCFFILGGEKSELLAYISSELLLLELDCFYALLL